MEPQGAESNAGKLNARTKPATGRAAFVSSFFKQLMRHMLRALQLYKAVPTGLGKRERQM